MNIVYHVIYLHQMTSKLIAITFFGDAWLQSQINGHTPKEVLEMVMQDLKTNTNYWHRFVNFWIPFAKYEFYAEMFAVSYSEGEELESIDHSREQILEILEPYVERMMDYSWKLKKNLKWKTLFESIFNVFLPFVYPCDSLVDVLQKISDDDKLVAALVIIFMGGNTAYMMRSHFDGDDQAFVDWLIKEYHQMIEK